MLVQHFIARVAPAETRGKIAGISAGALAMLRAYDWPGNIRQLENAIFRAVVLAEGSVLTVDEFPQIKAQVEGIDPAKLGDGPLSQPASAPDADGGVEAAPYAVPPVTEEPSPASHNAFGGLRALDDRGNVRALADVENEMIRLAVERYNGQMSEVARRLGIGRSTLYRKLKELGIDPDEGRGERLAS